MSVSSNGGPRGPHPSLTPLLAALETETSYYLLYPYLRFTLFDAATHSPAMFDESTAKPLFVLYQLLQLLEHCHRLGTTLDGELGLGSIFVDTRLWLQVRLPSSILRGGGTGAVEGKVRGDGEGVGGGGIGGSSSQVAESTAEVAEVSPVQPDSASASSPCASPVSDATATASSPPAPSPPPLPPSLSVIPPPTTSPASPLTTSYVTPSLTLGAAVEKWCRGELSNFDYLMVLNRHAGRCLGEPNNHPIFPWVMDFTQRNAGYRDLTQSKHRLSKGDRQLDFTFLSAQEEMKRTSDLDAVVPHHIADIASDVTYYVYRARQTPREVLCSRVRPRWVPEEYPSSIEKMFVWSPDECIPEFFVEPTLFASIHPDLPDLSVPDWCGSPAELVAVHRAVLESDTVSSNLHHWIDLNFGYKLSGEASVRAKNVYVSLVDKHRNPANCGIVQLFRSSHPKRGAGPSAPLPLLEWQSYLNKSSVMNVTAFSIGRHDSASAPPTSPLTSPPVLDVDTPKTLASILSQQRRQEASHAEEADGASPDNLLEDDSSFEHVVLPGDLKGGNGLSVSPVSIGIEYGSPSSLGSTPGRNPAAPKEGAVLNSMASQQHRFKVPVVNYLFKQRRTGAAESVAEGYSWRSTGVSLPKDSHVLSQMSRLEELAHFVSRSCKEYGELFQEQWESEDLLKLNVSGGGGRSACAIWSYDA